MNVDNPNAGGRPGGIVARENWKNVMVQGCVFIILGVLAFTLPIAFALTFELVLGWIFLAGGTLQLYRTSQNIHAPGAWMLGTSSIVAMLFGIMLLFHPLEGLLAVTFIIAIYFLIEGILKMVYAWQIRDCVSSIWTLVTGVVSIIIAAIILLEWPLSSMWFIAVMMGIYLFVNGLTLLWTATHARNN
jgi:uncharacterized membrane protein HdeD (DUF308 family)